MALTLTYDAGAWYVYYYSRACVRVPTVCAIVRSINGSSKCMNLRWKMEVEDKERKKDRKTERKRKKVTISQPAIAVAQSPECTYEFVRLHYNATS